MKLIEPLELRLYGFDPDINFTTVNSYISLAELFRPLVKLIIQQSEKIQRGEDSWYKASLLNRTMKNILPPKYEGLFRSLWKKALKYHRLAKISIT